MQLMRLKRSDRKDCKNIGVCVGSRSRGAEQYGVVSPSTSSSSSNHPRPQRGAGAVVAKARQDRHKLAANRRLNIAGPSQAGHDDDDDGLSRQGYPVLPGLPFGFSGIGGFSQPPSISTRHPTFLKVLKPIPHDQDIIQDKRIIPTAVHLYGCLLITSTEMFAVNSTKEWQNLNKERAKVAVQNALLRYNLPGELACHFQNGRALTKFLV